MAASFRNLVLALATASGFCALVPSCADNNQSIFIRQFQQAVAPDCTLTNDPTANAVFGGFVDLGVANNYTAFPLIGNQLSARGDAKQSKSEPNRVVIQGAQVELKYLNDAPIANVPAFTVLATGTVDPAASGSTDPVYGVAAVQLIPPAVAPFLIAALGGKLGASTSIKASIKVYGVTLGNKDVESGVVDFPISVCIGCSVAVPADAVKTDADDKQNCQIGITSTTTTAKTSCSIGQDSTTDCRLCQANTTACRPCSTDASCVGLRKIYSPPGKVLPATCNTSAGFCE